MAHSASAQTSDQTFDSFTTSAPDTVVQNEAFKVTYTLSASTWDGGCQPTACRGFRLTGVSYATQPGRPYSKLLITVTYTSSRPGLVELPAMRVGVNKKLVTATSKTVYVKPHTQYGSEMSLAHDWLVRHGQHPDSISLDIVAEHEYFRVFCDQKNQCFCVVANKDVWPLVGNPVLAYSTECHIHATDDSNAYKYLLHPYKKQIEALKASASQSLSATHLPYSPKSQSVAPMLGNLSWGQGTPFNLYSPTIKGKKVIVGCVPLAVAMVMNYHKWPERGVSQVYYQPDENIYKMDFTQCAPQWDTYRNSYQQKDSSQIENLSKLLTALGVSLDASFSEKGTSASCSNVKHVLCNNLKYSGKIAFYHHQFTDEETAAFIYRELDHLRPCIITNDGHAFVCDGYQDDFFHYNLGWHGSCNGFYRLKLGNYAPTGNESLILIKGVLGGIEPLRENRSKEVCLSEAGTLTELLTDEEKENITHLSITGPINSADIRMLRKMAGATNEKLFGTWAGGSLLVLDLTQAKIKKDKEPYLTQKATGTISRTHTQTVSSTGATTSKTYSFNFDKITEKEWKNFKSIMGEKSEWGFYSRTEDDKYWVNYTCISNEIGHHMFDGCSSLHHILLPEGTKRIGNYSFAGCTSLQSIRIPENVEEAGKIPFNRCTSLESVEIPHTLTLNGVLCDKCSPILVKATRY